MKMAQYEPMDIDTIGNEFDDKENSLQNSNVLSRTPCTEKGYEELDVSELNMKLRYSISPASSPMSKSYTANSKDNKTFNVSEDNLNSTVVIDNANLTRSLNSTMTKSDNISKSSKLPLQVLPTDNFMDNINSSRRRSLDNDQNNVTITINGTYNIDDNLSLPSTSSSTVQTPEATTPTNDIPKGDGGSPIMRGLKSVLNMFRSSQSPIPPEENTVKKDPIDPHSKDESIKDQSVLASTPKSYKNKDSNLSKRNSPLKESIVFNDDLEKELQWSDDSTIIFKQEKIPIHKLLLSQSTTLALEKKLTAKPNDSETTQLNTTVEYMDVSYNESGIADKTMTDIDTKIKSSAINIETTGGIESDGEFLDCETTYTKELESEQKVNPTSNNESNVSAQKFNEDKVVEQINQEKSNNSTNDEDLLKNDMILHANDNQFMEQINRVNILNEVEDAQSPNKNNEQMPFVPDKRHVDVEAHLKDEINTSTNINMTMDLDVSSTNIGPNNLKELSDTFIQHNFIGDESKTNENEIKENSSPNITNCLIKDQIELNDEKSKNLDKTSPLNVVTEENESHCSNNFVIIDKDNTELSEKNKPVNPGILQICSSASENYTDLIKNNGHEHVNSLACALNSNSSNANSGECETVKNIEQNIISVDPAIQTCIENSPKEETNLAVNDEIKDTLKSNQCDQFIVSQATQADTKDNEANILNSSKDVIQDIKETTIDVMSTNSDLENIYCSNTENNVTLEKCPSIEEKIELPSDIALPSDDDIEKDSLTDPFAIKQDDLKEMDAPAIICVSGDKTIDLLENIDKLCEEVVISKSVNSTKSNEIPVSTNMALQNIEHVSSIENISCYFDKQSELLNNEIQILQECTPIELPNNKSLLTETIPVLNAKSEYIKGNNNSQVMDVSACALDMDLQSNNINNDKNIDKELGEQSCNIVEKPEVINNINNDKNIDKELGEQSCNIVEKPEEVSDALNAITELNEYRDIDEEIVTSANHSPFVSVNEIDLNVPENDIKLDEVENPFETKCAIAMSPPISPKLIRKGYNINFDEIDDPFATKVKIRMSPGPEISPNGSCAIHINQDSEIKKKVQQNRRKSQPERQKRDSTKKRLNNSYSFSSNSNNRKEIKVESSDSISNGTTKILNQIEKPDMKSMVAATMPTTDDREIPNKCVIQDCNIIDKFNSCSEETLTIEKKVESSSEYTLNSLSNEQNNILVNNSTENTFPPKNVFNLPEIDDMNFNPFATKSKMRMSPSPIFEKENHIKDAEKTLSEASNDLSVQPSINIEKKCEDDKNVSPDLSSETNSSRSTDRDNTVKEIHTEDDDTVEGPFLEAEEFADVVKVSDFGKDSDMMQFEDLPPEVDSENNEDGELFIDAEAFEFLLNQNKSNVVADSGKESLFLKFDPLFAKRVSSDGVLAALNRIQKRQSTPKKPIASTTKKMSDEEKSIVSTSEAMLVPEESADEINATLNKPMMVVNPAIHSLVSPRKSTTPPRINRRSLTFTSPAMAVIDRLLSLSGNNSMLEQDTTLPRSNREYNETDIALTQLRELLAEKEINVHNLRSESKELKERLATMESQVKTLEKESEERLKKVTDLNYRLLEKTKINKSMAVVVEEYERTIASLIADMDQEKRRNAEERSRLINERDEQTAHLSSMEVSFNDLHSKYEKSKQIILSMKANEDTYRKSMKDFEDNLIKMQNNYELLKQHATSKLNQANQELEKFNRAHESEVLKLNAMIKRKDLHITSLEESLAQKTKANEELTAICDELINKVG